MNEVVECGMNTSTDINSNYHSLSTYSVPLLFWNLIFS